ncbi:MAG: DUF1963 domain-containing protein [Clostridia bacterium]|nr:DUF1963 domain-containing protein [Clostridia bacterium]
MNKNDKKKLLEILKSLFGNEIRITPERSKNPLSADASRIGGRPALPDGFVWPTYTGKAYDDDEPVERPLAFLAQINLKDTAPLDKDGLLPESGMLSFFYELETEKWGYEPDDKGSARVFYFPDVSALTVFDFPEELNDDYRLPEYELKFELKISVPYEDADEFEECLCEELCEFDYDSDDLESFLDDNELYSWGNSKLLGNPFIIQDSMEEECETVTRGYGCGEPGDSAGISKEEIDDIEEKSADWILLFQMSGIDDKLSFGDDGNIYFWIRKQDLADRDFSKVWLILQCY